MLRFRRHFALVLAASLLILLTPFSTTAAVAAPANHLIINQVFLTGGSTGAPYKNKYVEIYNPTSDNIDLSGYELRYYSKKKNPTDPATWTIQLSGNVKGSSYYLIKGRSNGDAGGELPTPNLDNGRMDPGRKAGALALFHSDQVVDKVGWGSSKVVEGSAATAPATKDKALGRTGFADTDNNAADFAPVTPQPHGVSGDEPVDPGTQVVEKTIAEIQGTGNATPFSGQKVATIGVVTAAYPTGGFNGFYIQTQGTSDANHSAQASDAIFVYVGRSGVATMPKIGQCVKVTGTVSEYYTLTQISPERIDPQANCQPVSALTLETWPTSDVEREKLEGMLVHPQGNYTITNNYLLNRYGSVDLAQGDEPLVQATDTVAPGATAGQYEAANKKKLVTLDDGSSFSFDISKRASNGDDPLPWITKDHTARAGAHVTFTKPVIVDYRHQWNFQPTQQQVGIADMPVTIEQNRPATPASVGGDIKVGTFNVLNYFTDLGQNEAGCTGYKDREGNFITAKRCKVRGAFRPADFKRQQAKIVNAINGLGADVVSLEEIENPRKANGQPDLANRDVPLATLVRALNAQAGDGNWDYVRSPANVPNNGDAIRVAFIYKPAKVSPVGQSTILDNKYFTGVARSPLAQEFAPVVDPTKQRATSNFTVIVNHFKSKGSVARFAGIDNNDKGDGQGNNNILRTYQAKALADFAKTFDGPVFLLGDLNAYGKEDPVTALDRAGYHDVESKYPPAKPLYSYQYGGRMGSLDHVLANSAAMDLVTGATVWQINAQEPISYEYSRYNNNVVNFWDDSPFRSSDHNPALIGLDVIEDVATPGPAPSPGTDPAHGPTPRPEPGVVPQPGPAGGATSTAKPAVASASASKVRLARTGSNALGLVAVGVVVLSAGVLVMLMRRNDRKDM